MSMDLPLSAKASIVHRITGLILFFSIGFLLYVLDLSLSSEQSFNQIGELMSHPISKFIGWGILTALGYHFVAGIKHLLMDWGVGENVEAGRLGAMITIASAVVLSVLAGIWVW